MSRRIQIIIVALLLAGIAAWLFVYEPYARRREAIAAISRYNVAVAQAYASMDESQLGQVAAPGEINRLTTYMIGLKGTKTILESEMMSLDVTKYRAAEPTYTVTTTERWKVVERDEDSGQMRGAATIWRHYMKYTLIDGARGVIVYRSDLRKQTAEAPE